MYNMFKHIVLSGGGPTGFISYGVLKTLHQEGIWNHNIIETMYGASSGSLVCVMVALGLDWKTIDDYLIKRPWHKALQPVSSDILNLIANKGIDGKELITIVMKPLLQAAGLDIDSTMQDFKNKTGIDVHIASVDMNGEKTLTQVDICAETKPNMRVCDALVASFAVPILFQPLIHEDSCYIDGGILNNYPVSVCLDNHPNEKAMILGVKNVWKTEKLSICSESSFVDFMRFLLRKMHNTLDSSLLHPELDNEVVCDVSDVSNAERWVESIDSESLRANLVSRGEEIAKKFIADKILNVAKT